MILASLGVFAVVFTAIVYVTARIFQAAVSRLVLARHRDLEEIMNTQEVPRAWGKPSARAYLAKLGRLRHYVETTRLVDGEETRQLLLDRLAELGDRVQQGAAFDEHAGLGDHGSPRPRTRRLR